MNAASCYLVSRNNRLLYFALILGVALALWGLRLPGFDLGFLAAATVAFLVAALFIITRVIVRAVFTWKKKPGLPRPFEGAIVWIRLLYTFVLLVALGFYGLPFKAALALSRPSLDSFARASAGGQKAKEPLWIGLFCFESVIAENGHLELTFRKPEFPWGKRGLYYSFSGAPVESSHYHDQENLGGGWYAWHYGGW
jgi:hypothetical protein